MTTHALQPVSIAEPALRRRSDRIWLRTLLRNKTAIVGAVIVLIFVAIALASMVVNFRDPMQLNVMDSFHPPSREYPLGTDQVGRDVLSRLAYGAQLSLGIGFSVMVLSTLGGTILGLLSGFYRWLDLLLSQVMDAMMAFPSILFAIVVMGLLGPSVTNVILALTIVSLPRAGRLARSAVLVAREEVYVEAARASGVSDAGILFRHVLPNIMSPLITQASYVFATAVLAEAALSFIGVGAPPQIPSWGNMLAEGRAFVQQAPWLTIYPGLAIVLVVLGANLFGDGLRDALDPRLRTDG